MFSLSRAMKEYYSNDISEVRGRLGTDNSTVLRGDNVTRQTAKDSHEDAEKTKRVIKEEKFISLSKSNEFMEELAYTIDTYLRKVEGPTFHVLKRKKSYRVNIYEM